MSSTLTKQLVHAYWKIVEDFPIADGEYVVCFLTDDGDYGLPEVWSYTSRNGWEPLFDQGVDDQPTHWCSLPMPK
jgi:hypothetical protein